MTGREKLEASKRAILLHDAAYLLKTLHHPELADQLVEIADKIVDEING